MKFVITKNPAEFDQWSELLDLLHRCFAYMDSRIDPPSSLHRLSAEDLQRKAGTEDLYLAERDHTPVACLFGTPKEAWYYVGKLAVDPSCRGTGLARTLMDAASQHAKEAGLKGVELQSRVELTGNHRTFRAMGFHLVGASAHPGFDRATSLTFRRAL